MRRAGFQEVIANAPSGKHKKIILGYKEQERGEKEKSATVFLYFSFSSGGNSSFPTIVFSDRIIIFIGVSEQWKTHNLFRRHDWTAQCT